jgi:hypothetical protein
MNWGRGNGLGLAAAVVAAGAALYGWRGAVLGLTVATFGMLVQFSRALRVMRHAAQAPVGVVASASALNRALRPGMQLVQVIRLAGSLGEALSAEPEVWRWRDPTGAAVSVTFAGGRAATWQVAAAETPATGDPP